MLVLQRQAGKGWRKGQPQALAQGLPETEATGRAQESFLASPRSLSFTQFLIFFLGPCMSCVGTGVNCTVSFWGLSWRRTRTIDLLQFDRLLQTEAHILPEAHGRAQEDDHLLLKLEDMCL